ncbi:hypothetical protein RCL1_001946 [Eukaryota sp. TZLM3-RCL]
MNPFLFCLAIHPVLVGLQSRFPNIRIVTYMDDISLIGSPYDLDQAAVFAFHEFESLGLSLNAKKCLLIGRSSANFNTNSETVSFVNYSSEAFRFLGCFLGNKESISDKLNIRLNEIHVELDTVSKLDIEILHPEDLLFLEGSKFQFLREHIFCSLDLGGVGFTKTKVLSKAALIGSGKNFVFEFSSRFSPDLALLSSNCSPFLLALEHEINTLPLDVWTKCFPIEVQENPVKYLSNLKYAKKKLQHFLVKELESLDYTNRLCLAKMNNPAFYQFLLDITDSSASSLFSQIRQIYGLLLNNEEWKTFIRLRCYLWPQQLVNGFKCKCDTPVSLTHLFNCHHLVTFRRCLHDNVYKDIYQMAKAFRIETFREPVLRKLQDVSSSDDNRGDLIMPWFKSSQLITDVVTANPCNATNQSSSVNVVNKAEARKISKYSDLLSKLNASQFNSRSMFLPRLEFLFMVVLVIQVSNLWKISGVLLKKDTTSV